MLRLTTPLHMDSGATFMGPKGFVVTTRSGMMILEDPSKEVSVAFVALQEKDGAAAITASWKQRRPGFSSRMKGSPQVLRPGHGWDESLRVDYAPEAAEKRETWAVSRRHGDTSYVTLFDGTESGWEKHRIEALSAYKSLRAPGVDIESFRGMTAHTLDKARLDKLEAFVEEARQKLKIPGMAISIVQNGRVVLERGFGVRKLGTKDPVTPDTVFRIASLTKPLTTLLLARLVDEGKFRWDTRVTELFPSFALGDPTLTRQITMRQTMCGCSGLPREDAEGMFYPRSMTGEQMIAGMKKTRPTAPLGAVFQYSNPIVSAGGYVAAHVAFPEKPLAAAFQAAMAEQIFRPLHMTKTTLDTAAVEHRGIAYPHTISLQMEPVTMQISDDARIDIWAPAAAAWSNVRDYSRYLLLELSRGKTPDGRRLVSEVNLIERRKPVVIAGDWSRYGLGLDMSAPNDVAEVGHSGLLTGYSSDMFFLPEHHVGVVILCNMGNSDEWYGVFHRKLREVLFDGQEDADEDLPTTLLAREEEHRNDLSDVELAPDRAWLEKLAGTYRNPDLGEVRVRIEGEKGVFETDNWKSAIGRTKEANGRVTGRLVTPPYTFPFVPREVVGKMSISLEPPQKRYLFERIDGTP